MGRLSKASNANSTKQNTKNGGRLTYRAVLGMYNDDVPDDMQINLGEFEDSTLDSPVTKKPADGWSEEEANVIGTLLAVVEELSPQDAESLDPLFTHYWEELSVLEIVEGSSPPESGTEPSEDDDGEDDEDGSEDTAGSDDDDEPEQEEIVGDPEPILEAEVVEEPEDDYDCFGRCYDATCETCMRCGVDEQCADSMVEPKRTPRPKKPSVDDVAQELVEKLTQDEVQRVAKVLVEGKVVYLRLEGTRVKVQIEVG